MLIFYKVEFKKWFGKLNESALNEPQAFLKKKKVNALYLMVLKRTPSRELKHQSDKVLFLMGLKEGSNQRNASSINHKRRSDIPHVYIFP